MRSNENFLDFVSELETNPLEFIRVKIQSRSQRRALRKIGCSIQTRLDELKWKEKDLANKLWLSPKQIRDAIKGKEILHLGKLKALERLLGIRLVHLDFYEKREKLQTINFFYKLIHVPNHSKQIL